MSASPHASVMAHPHTTDIVESLETFVERMQEMKDGGGNKETLFENVKRFARSMQQKVAKLGGVSAPKRQGTAATSTGYAQADDGLSGDRSSYAPMRASNAGRASVSTTLDGYRPDTDVVAPISVRPNAMELLWVCGDCGEHYPRARACPEQCVGCGAPKQNFYAPIED